jgi:hypothetical protein
LKCEAEDTFTISTRFSVDPAFEVSIAFVGMVTAHMTTLMTDTCMLYRTRNWEHIPYLILVQMIFKGIKMLLISCLINFS